MTLKGISYVASGIDVPVCLDKSNDFVQKAVKAKFCVEAPNELPSSITVMVEDESTI